MAARSRVVAGEPPLEVDHVWRWYCDLSGSRSSNGFGLNPISFSEIAAWSALSGVWPSPWEVSLLKRLDMVTLANQKKPTGDPDVEPEIEVAADDDEGVKGIFAMLKARSQAIYGKAN